METHKHSQNTQAHCWPQRSACTGSTSPHIMCLEKLANDRMKLSEMARHLKTEHPEQEDKRLQFFQWYFKLCDIQSSTLQNLTELNDKCLEAFFEVSYFIAKDKKPHTTGETLVLPAMVKTAAVIRRKQYSGKKMHSFVSKHCWKMHRKHCWRFEETSISTNYTVQEVCYAAYGIC